MISIANFYKKQMSSISMISSCNSKQLHNWLIGFNIVFAFFEIAWRTGAPDQQKQWQSSKATVYAGPKDRQSALILEIPIGQMLLQTHLQFKSVLVVS